MKKDSLFGHTLSFFWNRITVIFPEVNIVNFHIAFNKPCFDINLEKYKSSILDWSLVGHALLIGSLKW